MADGKRWTTHNLNIEHAASCGYEPSDPVAKTLRELRNRNFNAFNFPSSPAVDANDPRFGGKVMTITLSVLPELPGDQSDTIPIGSIKAIQPYLSESHSSVYSEYSVSVEKVIDKQDPELHTNPASGLLEIDQVGGIMILPGGRRIREDVEGLGRPPATGGRYVFFLIHVTQGDFYQIVKAWELKDGRVKAMAPDDLARSANKVSNYDGMNAF